MIPQHIIETLGLDKLSEAERTVAVEQLGALIFQGVMLEVIKILSDEDKTALEKVIEESRDNPEPVLAFLREKVPTLNEIVAEEVSKITSQFKK